MRHLATSLTVYALLAANPEPAAAALFLLSDPSGLSAEVEFNLLGPTTLEIRAKNTSEDAPPDFLAADQILTGISWDFGAPGIDMDDPVITGGSVVIGPSSASLNFDTGSYGPGFDVSGEYGFGNNNGSGALINFVSANGAQATPFGGANLDGPPQLDGPQAGIVANPAVVPLGGLGAIQDEIIATVTLSKPLANLDFLYENHVRVEFGSDAAFIPEPSTFLLLASSVPALLVYVRRKRRSG